MSDLDIIYRDVDTEIEQVLEGERAVIARISTGGVDRYDTIIDPLGCDVSHFNKTRSVLYHHGKDPVRGTLPIGRGWAKVRRAEKDMIAKTVFDTDEFSDICFQKCRSGSLNGWSIQAKAREVSPPTRAEIRSNPSLERCKWICRSWDLLEYSLTPTAANSDCLNMLISRGFIAKPEWFTEERAATGPQKEDEPETVDDEDYEERQADEDDKDDPLKRYITESDGTFTVHAESGKPLGKYKSKAAAEHRLKQIEYFKHKKAERSAPTIEQDGPQWWVIDNRSRILSFTDERLAQQALAFAQQRSHFDVGNLIRASVNDIRRESADIQELAAQYIALYTTGRI